ncbi:NAD(P)/FAD-dependent oxidoreductase [Saccharospirillum salsuginis]|uniref:Thioredoxin reductase n=1 Tax=Saccharospirillum salsuginis TaxID=418750 RepID=A0A918KDM6_9GAMM|nr:NAD(P)/FAD-dependent oxidoreductase [Saccharospirillum salsuginis]GGX58170.1 thioredoxin reductase [Saccharospirillum salsuginis]
MNSDHNDLIIIGGGPAGQSAALIAGRTRLKTVLINAETPRNLVTTASHGFLTRDGVHPSELLAIAKEQLQRYPSVQYVADQVEAVDRIDRGFSVTTSQGTILRTSRLIIATGHRDHLERLNLPGIESVYGKSVYPCPFCDGYEHADEAIAVFGFEAIQHFVPMMRLWSNDIVVFSNGRPLDTALKAELTDHGVAVEEAPVDQLMSDNGKLTQVVLQGGRSIPRQSGFVVDDYSSPATHFAESLGVVANDNNSWNMPVMANESGTTSIPGLYLIGDARIGFSGIAAAASEGGFCVEMIAHDIAMERWNSLSEVTR